MRKFIRIVSIISSWRGCTQIIFLFSSFLMLMFVSCGSNGVKVNELYTDEEIKARLGEPDNEKIIILKPDMSIDLYEYQSELYRFIPETDSLIVIEQIYKNGQYKKIIWLTEYGKKKKVLDVLDYNTLTTHIMEMKNYNIIISEPWDFTNSDGSNIISGQIIRIVNEEIAIFRCNEKILLNGFEGDSFLLSRRFLHERFFKGVMSITVNGAGISSCIEDISPSMVRRY